MKLFKKIIICIIFSCIIFSSVTGFALSCESKYFKINVADSLDLYEILVRLNIKSYLHVDAAKKVIDSSLTGILKENIDALYLEVSDCLDIHVYSFQINLEIVPDNETLIERIGPFAEDLINPGSYYSEQKNTIYISFKALGVSALAHETAEAIISHYFLIPPPEKFRKILAGYVESTVNRIDNTSR